MGWWVAPQPVAASHPLVTEQPAETEHLMRGCRRQGVVANVTTQLERESMIDALCDRPYTCHARPLA